MCSATHCGVSEGLSHIVLVWRAGFSQTTHLPPYAISPFSTRREWQPFSVLEKVKGCAQGLHWVRALICFLPLMIQSLQSTPVPVCIALLDGLMQVCVYTEKRYMNLAGTPDHRMPLVICPESVILECDLKLGT